MNNLLKREFNSVLNVQTRGISHRRSEARGELLSSGPPSAPLPRRAGSDQGGVPYLSISSSCSLHQKSCTFILKEN
jgi:hypothetical protein